MYNDVDYSAAYKKEKNLACLIHSYMDCLSL